MNTHYAVQCDHEGGCTALGPEAPSMTAARLAAAEAGWLERFTGVGRESLAFCPDHVDARR